MSQLRIGITEKPDNLLQWFLLSLQHLVAMFGATVLIPIIINGAVKYEAIPLSLAVFATGIGTLLYILITKGKSPVYLGSSGAFLAISITALLSGPSTLFIGLLLSSLTFGLISLIIRFTGTEWLQKILSPVIVGPMIMIIGFTLVRFALGGIGVTLMGYANDGTPLTNGFTLGVVDVKVLLVATFTFFATILILLKGKGFAKIIPFILGITLGVVFALLIGVDGAQAEATSLFESLSNPDKWFNYKEANWTTAIMFIPVAITALAEHIGDHKVLGEIVGEDLLEDPGLDKTIAGNAAATLASASMGGIAVTTYGENTGVVALTKVGSTWVTGLAAVMAIILSMITPLMTLIGSIPGAVMAGVGILLYGLIGGNGLKVLINEGVDLNNTKNLLTVSTMLILGFGITLLTGNTGGLKFGEIVVPGMVVAMVVGILMNTLLPDEE